MKQLAVIIVNYNVKHFLEQCLLSVFKAIKNIDAEVYVVDNNSVDGSCSMIKEKFPQVKLIENKENKGFSYANNQALRLTTAKYILILNPDTVIEEDSLEKTIAFMEEHPEAGGLGVKMIDGKGDFLPESKRGLPYPMVAFYKIFGLSKLFPSSKRFGRYHLSYLDKNKVHQIDVLAGAFMLLRKKVLDKIGLFDENFFMYGEDIDLSYRILKAGYKNYYYPYTTIIHYKGESTKKSSINYVKLFYKAMIIFAKKHFSKSNAKSLSLLINCAIYSRAFLAFLSRLIKNIFLPCLDAIGIFLGFYIIIPLWEVYKFPEGGHYPKELLLIAVPVYISVWLINIYLTGGYDKPVKISKLIKGNLCGTIIILLIYSLLSEKYRFSRALIILGALWTFIYTIILRFILNSLNIKEFKLAPYRSKKIVIIGKPSETKRISEQLKKINIKHEIVGYVSPDNTDSKNWKNYIANINQLKEIIRVNKVDEIIFSARDLSMQTIIKNMLKLSDKNLDFKIASPNGISIIGSSSINSQGDLYIIEINSIAQKHNKTYKRILDLLLSILFIILFPFFFIFYVKKPFKFLLNILKVLFGKYSWVGYYEDNIINIDNLPRIKKGIFSPLMSNNKISKEKIEQLNMLYAKEYTIWNDLHIILKKIKDIRK